MGSLYRRDVTTWSRQQAAALRQAAAAGSNLAVDWENVAEEIESVGTAERNALRSQLFRVIEHLMKLQASPARDPRRGWIETIIDARHATEDVLEASPSLRGEIADMIERQTPRARSTVARKMALYGEAPSIAMDALTYTEEQVLGWYPAP